MFRLKQMFVHGNSYEITADCVYVQHNFNAQYYHNYIRIILILLKKEILPLKSELKDLH